MPSLAPGDHSTEIMPSSSNFPESALFETGQRSQKRLGPPSSRKLSGESAASFVLSHLGGALKRNAPLFCGISCPWTRQAGVGIQPHCSYVPSSILRAVCNIELPEYMYHRSSLA